MSEISRKTALCSNCQMPGSFNPRVDLDSSEEYVNGLSELDPFTLDHHEIKEKLSLCDEDLAGYDVEVIRLQSQILFIKEQQKRLRAHRERLLGVSSSVRRIPNEILSSIFNYACEWNLFQEFPWRFSERNKLTKLTAPIISYLPALSLSATCSQWRSVAKSSPNLWSRLKLEIGSGDAKNNMFVNIVALFLARSGSNPLDIHLYICGEPRLPIHYVLFLIVQQHKRWMSLYYSGNYTISNHIGLDLNEADFPLLESLKFVNHRNPPGDLDIFEKSPKLESLFLYGLVQSQIPWTQLTRLDLCETYSQLDVILDTCPNLTSVGLFEFDETSYRAFENAPPRTSEAAQTLRVLVDSSRNSSPGLLEQVFLSFTFPALNRLSISAFRRSSYNRGWPMDSFGAFLSRSSCRITTLSLVRIGFSDTDLISVLQLLPFLMTLKISDHEAQPEAIFINSSLISSLHSSGQNIILQSSVPENMAMPLLPGLRYLTLESDCIDFDDDAFISMVRSRWHPHRRSSTNSSSTVGGVDCLRSVVMRFHKRRVDEMVYRPIRDLDRAGLRVVVRGMDATIV